MSSSGDESDLQHPHSEMHFIAQELNCFPEILEKSQLPNMKKKKDEAIEKLLTKYNLVFGKEIDSKVLMKKVNNMKTRIKKKADKSKTGNKKIKLVEWEKIMYSTMRGSSNPTINKIPGAQHCGIRTDSPQLEIKETVSGTSEDFTVESVSENTKILPPPRKESLLDEYETSETRDLDTKALQRLVLLEQLKTTRVQGEYFKEKLKRLNNMELSSFNSALVVDEHDEVLL